MRHEPDSSGDNRQNRGDARFVRIRPHGFDYAFAERETEPNEKRAPNRSSNERKESENIETHSEYAGRNGNQMADNRNEPTEKRIEPIVFRK